MTKRYSHDPENREVEDSIRAVIDACVARVKADYGRRDELGEIRLLTTVYLKRAYDLLSDARSNRFFLEGGRLRWEQTGVKDEPLPSDSEVKSWWQKEGHTTWEAQVGALTQSVENDDDE